MSSLPPVLAFHVFLDGLVDDLPLAPVLGPGPRIALAFGARQLTLELAVAGQTILAQAAVGQRGPNGAARLAVVRGSR